MQRWFTSVTAIGAWGDNLAGDAMLKVGSPIRVELVLWDNSGQSSGQQGYKVIKLEPAELDRVSDYGHLAADNGDGTFSAIPADLGAIVHDPEATLKIVRLSDGAVAFEGAAGGEINATGKIVYGYNLRVAEAGTYRITYTLPNVSLDGCDAGALRRRHGLSRDRGGRRRWRWRRQGWRPRWRQAGQALTVPPAVGRAPAARPRLAGPSGRPGGALGQGR